MSSLTYSIIVPVYNAENTLCKCVDSLLNKIPQDVEIILVNDGSKDSSARICEEYKSKFSQIVYINKENGGVSSARNAGLDVATGKYVLFVDSDDFVVEDFYEILDSATQIDENDIIFFSHVRVNKDKKDFTILKDRSFASAKEVSETFGEGVFKKWINSPCSRVYRMSIITENNLRFLETMSIGEDLLFNILYCINVKKFSFDSRVLNCINIENENSLSRRLRDDVDEQGEILRAEVKKQLELKKAGTETEQLTAKEIQKALNFCQLRNAYAEAKRLRRRNIPTKERLKIIRGMCKKINSEKLCFPKTLYCMLIAIPVRLHFAIFIDLFAGYLNHSN